MRFDKKAAIVIFVAVLTALVFVSSYLFMIVFRNDNYFTLTVVNGVDGHFLDQTTYAANIRDVVDGHFIVTDSFIYEQKGKLNIISPWLPYFILGLMTYVTGSVSNTILIGNFIFPFILFLLIYFIAYRATKDQYAGIASAVFMLLGYMFILTPPYNIENTLSFLSKNFDASSPLNYFSRIPYIQLTFVLMAASMMLLYLTLEKKNKLYYSIATGIVAGLLFYTYLYHWMAFFIGLFILTIIFVKKKKTELVKYFVIIIIIAAIVSIPYWVIYSGFSADKAYYKNISEKLGIENERFNADMPKTIKYSAILIVFVMLSKKKDNYFYMLSSLFVAGIIGLNLMLITGFDLHFRHFESTLLLPLSALVIIYTIWQIYKSNYTGRLSIVLSRIGKFYKHILISIIIFFILTGFSAQYTYARNTYQYYAVDKDSREAYDWLDRNTETDDVVLALSTEQNFLIPVFTHDNIFLPNGAISTVTTNETTERFYIASRLFGVNSSYIEEVIDGINSIDYSRNEATKGYDKGKFEKAVTMMYLYHRKYYDTRINSFVLPKEDILSGYSNYTSDVNELFSKYRIDYIFVGPHEKKVGNIIFLNMTELVWSNDIIDIYKVKYEKA